VIALSYGKPEKKDLNVHTSTVLCLSTKITGNTYKVNGIGILGLQAAAGMNGLLIPIGNK
jgi:hypothetical protein